MTIEELKLCITFFRRLNIDVVDITTPADASNQNKVVLAEYIFDGRKFKTRPLYYKEVSGLDNVRNIDRLHKYFGDKVFWLDIQKHDWPKPSGESDLDHLVVNGIMQEGDENFKELLLQLANNQQSGFIQKITRDGRSGQYYHNLENNNHWHDLVLFIKEAIAKKGRNVEKEFFQHLIFNWDKGKRTSLNLEEPYKIVTDLYKNLQNIQPDMNFASIESLLRYKKQIILQGPPGTGKTKLAKELAAALTGIAQVSSKHSEITDHDIVVSLSNVHKIRTVAGNVQYEIINVDIEDKTVLLKKSTESNAFTTFSKIKEFYQNKFWESNIANNDDRRAAAIAKYIFDNRITKQILQNSEQFKLIQFHPSYSYEDFVRGIVAKPNDNGSGILYVAENKTIATFAEAAKKNQEDANKGIEQISDEVIFASQLEQFSENVRDEIDRTGEFKIGEDTSAKIVGLLTDAFIYSFDKRRDIKYTLLFSDLKAINSQPMDIARSIDVRDIEQHLSMKGKYPYYFRVYNLIKGISSPYKLPLVENKEFKNYVLIIDEINRANLSSVLGELIYALEYRSEEVESMYEVSGSNKLVLPPNLYIIGTMNTADRSVGHIDYAIRRRFAFVSVEPKDLTAELGAAFHKSLFDQVAALFNHEMNLSQEFDSKDVQLGHSYFIDKKDEGGSMDIRLEYEIKPILLEYVKDGVLVGDNIVNKIKSLTV
ncbi:MAG: AAA family ATPase [Ferruginibacter sp.]